MGARTHMRVPNARRIEFTETGLPITDPLPERGVA